MEFTNSWFQEQAKPVWERRLKDYFQTPIKYLEIGVCQGASTAWILQNIPTKFAIGVDPWLPRRARETEPMKKNKELAHKNLAPYMQEGRLQLACGSSFEVVPALRHEFDLIYIDGDHRAAEAMLDIGMAFQKLASRGVIVIDDLHRTWVNGKPQVFCSVYCTRLLYHGRLEVLWEDGRQIAFRKTR